MNSTSAWILAFGLIVAALAAGGRYTVTTNPQVGSAWVVDRWTGDVRSCLKGCREL